MLSIFDLDIYKPQFGLGQNRASAKNWTSPTPNKNLDTGTHNTMAQVREAKHNANNRPNPVGHTRLARWEGRFSTAIPVESNNGNP